MTGTGQFFGGYTGTVALYGGELALALGPDYGFRATYPGSYVTLVWEFPLDDYNFKPDTEYTLTVGNFFAYVPSSVAGKSSIKVWAGLTDVTGSQSLAEEDLAIFDQNSPEGPTAVGANIRYFEFSSETNPSFKFAFTKPAVPGARLYFTVEIAAKAVSADVNVMSSGGPWYAFHSVKVVEGADANEEWKDEQRGLWARLWEFLQGMWDAITGIPEAIAGFFRELGDKITQVFEDFKEWIRSLFIPEDGAIQELVEDFKLFAEGKLGFVAQIFTLVGDVIGQMLEGGGGNVVLTFPSVTLPAAFGGKKLWDNSNLDLTAMVSSSPAMATIYTIYKVLASVLLLGLLLRYLYKVASDILGQRDGGGDV